MAASLRQTGQRLVAWYRRNGRDLPWRRTQEPYLIWVSEIMLQQTRVEAVIPYYERFLHRFPTIADLAAAPEADVLEHWAGLGYYRRARQLQAAAQQIVVTHGGTFPADYAAIRALPGIGDYTSAAIASISFRLPHAVLDGNVMRVLARLHNDSRDISKGSTKKAMQQTVQVWLEALPVKDHADFNQATMELGATVCTPRSPKCDVCPLVADCAARQEGTQAVLPFKSSRQRVEKLELAVAVVEKAGRLLVRQRPASEEVMPGFWELPQTSASRIEPDCFFLLGIELGDALGEFKHAITYRTFRGTVYQGRLDSKRPEEYRWITRRSLAALPVTTITKKALAAMGT